MKKNIICAAWLVVYLVACSDPGAPISTGSGTGTGTGTGTGNGTGTGTITGTSTATGTETVTPVPNVGLEAKLAARFQTYQELRQSFIQGHRQSHPLSRQQLNQQLTVRETTPWTDADTQELIAFQQQRIQESLIRSQAASRVDLGAIRSGGIPSIRNFCESFPKGGMLHVHLMGTLGAETIDQILMSSQITFNNQTFRNHPDYQSGQLGNDSAPYSSLSPAQKVNGVLPYYRLSADRTYTFLEFDHVFGINMNNVRDHDLARTQSGARSFIMDGFAQRMMRHHVSYAEVSFTWAYAGFIQMLARQAAQIEAETHGGTVIRLTLGVVRGGSLTSTLDSILNATRINGIQYLQGVDLVGNESVSTALNVAQNVYNTVHVRNHASRSEPLHLTMHAGEFGAPENPRDAILMGAERIGHAVKLDQDPVTTEFAARNHFPIEANPLSNLKLGVVPSIAAHPFLKQLRLGMRVSLSTDDEGIFNTTISQECEAVVRETDITYAELKQMSLNSIDTAFLPEDRKAILRQNLDAEFARFEATL